MTLHFANGSNLDETRMRERCISARCLFKPLQRGFQLAFTRFFTPNRCGAAAVLPQSSSAVWGVVYHRKDEHLPGLDKAEGVGVRADTPLTVAVPSDGDRAQRLKAVTLIVVTREDPHAKPSAGYKARLVDGAKAWKFPPDDIAGLQSIAVTGQGN